MLEVLFWEDISGSLGTSHTAALPQIHREVSNMNSASVLLALQNYHYQAIFVGVHLPSESDSIVQK